MDRRQFLVLLCGGTCGCGAALAYQGRLEGGRVLVRLDELPAAFSEKGYALVRAAGLTEPLLLRKVEGGAFSALSARCTHLGCQVRPARRALICPCHGSSFSWEGKVLRGPAQKPLPRYSVEAKEEILEITID